MLDLNRDKEDIKTFSDLELQDLFDFIGEIMSLNSLTHSLPKDCREFRFAKGEVCPHCKIYAIISI
ncbi:hypothetical protein [Clostridium sp. CF012]|uniref:hypothetical protein n=1 Tax=Clostridium sp. CF012 TaxID=2843319 RepID=UPI001C0CAC53|nr:hypothetical protein [Clostridium sp. CF012]MBU3146292.1 hypothetical protein [Clostridium sp. CF012]